LERTSTIREFVRGSIRSGRVFLVVARNWDCERHVQLEFGQETALSMEAFPFRRVPSRKPKAAFQMGATHPIRCGTSWPFAESNFPEALDRLRG